MTSKFVAIAFLSVAAWGAAPASAEMFNPWLFDQMAVPSTRTRAEVRAELLQAQQSSRQAQAAAPAATSSYDGVLAQQTMGTASEKAGASPQASIKPAKTAE